MGIHKCINQPPLLSFSRFRILFTTLTRPFQDSEAARRARSCLRFLPSCDRDREQRLLSLTHS